MSHHEKAIEDARGVVCPNCRVGAPSGAKMPERIQRKRTKGWEMPPNTIIVTRPSEWGNPFRVVRGGEWRGHEDHARGWWVETESQIWMFATRDEAASAAVRLFKQWLDQPQRSNLIARARIGLRGKNLACWCPLDMPCHADVLLKLANG